MLSAFLSAAGYNVAVDASLSCTVQLAGARARAARQPGAHPNPNP
jgi:hypothetical protein